MTGVPVRSRRGPAPRALRRILSAWHATCGVGSGAALLAVVAAGAGPEAGLPRTALSSVLVAGVVANLLTASLLLAGRPTGRTWSLVVNHLTAFVSTVVVLQRVGVFVGLDTLGDRFHIALPFLGLALVGWLVTGGEDAGERRRRVGRWVMLAGFGGSLLAVGILPGLLTLFQRLAEPVGVGLVALAVAAGVLAWRTYQPDVAADLEADLTQRHTIDGLLFVSPNLLGFLAFFAGPLLFSLYVSLNEWDAFGTTEFIGLDNYVSVLGLDLARVAGDGAVALKDGYLEVLRVGGVVLGARDPLFWRSIGNILRFSALAIPLAVVPAVFLAVLLNSKVPGIKLFRALYFVPSIAGVIAVALIWRQLFNSTVGWVNYLVTRAVGAWNSLPFPDVSDPQVQWLSDADVALYSLVIVFAWQYVGFNTVLFFAGLQGIPGDLYEAATLDGASRWQQFRHITLPSLRPTTFFVVASTGILALQLFGESVVLFPTTTPAGAGPGNSTLTPVVYLYEQGFRRFSQGYASAVAWVLFALIFAFTFLQFQRQREEAV